MKNFTLCLSLFFLISLQSNAQVSIGDGTSTNKHVPFEAHSPYSYAQSIYLASEIGTSGNITAVRWYFSGATSDDWNMQGLDYSQDIKIYIGHTSKTEFTSNEDWILGSNLELAYEGAIPVENTGWVTVDLDSPFTYNGTDNLVIAVKESMEGADPADADFWAFQVVGNRSISSYGYEPQNVDEPPYADYLGSFVPNIVFEGIIQPCPHPVNIELLEVESNSLTLNWDPLEVFSSAGTQYYISESDENPTVSTAATGSVGTGINTVTVTTGLNPATQYYVWLRDVCEDGPGNWSPSIAFITDCLPTSLVNEDFDNSLSLPICWSTLLRGDGLSADASIGIVDWDSNSGTNSVSFYNDSSNETADLFLISPPLDNLAAGTHRLKFFASSYNGADLMIGTLDSNLPDAIFSDVDIVTVTNNFHEYTVDFSEYTQPGSYLAIKMMANTAYTDVYVDDIRWEVAPDCADISLISIPLTTTTTATIAWTPTGTETEWEIVVAPEDVTTPEGLTPVFATINPTGLIENLLENKSYNVWVRSICAAGEGVWIGPVTFTTACSSINNFSESFDSTEVPELASCWTKIVRGEEVNEEWNINVVDYNALTGSNAVAIQKGFSEVYSNEVILVSPNLGNLTAGTHRLKFFAKNDDGIGLEIGTLTSNTSTAVFTPFEEIAIADVYTEYKIDFSNFVDYDTPLDSYIGIRIAVTNSQPSTVFLDDIKWEVLPICPDATDLSVSALESNTATIHWVAGGAEAQWQIVYGDLTVNTPLELIPSEVLTTPIANLAELTDNTSYKVWVRSVCSTPQANGDWNGPLLFTTKCISATYINENFDSVIIPELPGCWSSILRGESLSSGAFVRTVQYQSNTEPYAVRINNSGTAVSNDIILVSPALGNLSGSHQVKFNARRLGDNNIEIGTLDTNTSTATFTPLQTVMLNPNYTQHTVVVNYEGEDTYLGFRIISDESYGSVLIDDVIWEPVSMCVDIASPSVTGITMNTANVSWEIDSGDVQVVYGLASVSNPNVLTPTALISSSVELTDLESNTAYKFWIRSVCTQGFGSWIGPIEFYTKCSYTEVPYTEDFEGLLAPALPNCSSAVNMGQANNWLSNYPIDYESTALTYGGANIAANAWFFTQGVNLVQGQNYTISYDFGNRGFDTSESFKVMYGTADNPVSMALPLADHALVSETVLESNEVLFTAPTSDVYYFGFNAYSSADQDILFVDNINIDTTLSNGDFSDDNFNFYPNPVKDFLTLSHNQEISTIEIYNILGQLVVNDVADSNSIKVDMSEFPQGTYLVKVTSGEYVKTIKILKQ